MPYIDYINAKLKIFNITLREDGMLIVHKQYRFPNSEILCRWKNSIAMIRETLGQYHPFLAIDAECHLNSEISFSTCRIIHSESRIQTWKNIASFCLSICKTIIGSKYNRESHYFACPEFNNNTYNRALTLSSGDRTVDITPMVNHAKTSIKFSYALREIFTRASFLTSMSHPIQDRDSSVSHISRVEDRMTPTFMHYIGLIIPFLTEVIPLPTFHYTSSAIAEKESY